MAQEKPTAIKSVTEEEVKSLTRAPGKRSYKWEFPKETFNGEWWGLEIPNNKVSSAMNSYRNQCEALYGTRANAYRGSDGRVFVRRLVDEPKERAESKRKDDE